MKLLFIVSLIMMSQEAMFVKGKCYEGYIFNESYDFLMTIEDQKGRYTPSKEEVERAEELIRDQLEGVNETKINQVDNCPIIHKKLKKYSRQYVGFLKSNNQKVLWVNFIWSKANDSTIKQLPNDIIMVNDGCSYYWNVKVNLSTQELFDLDINGIG